MIDSRRCPALALGLALALSAGAVPAAAEVHRLPEGAPGHPTFAVREPILTVRPGDIVEASTLWGDWYERAGGAWPGELGPIAVAGAEPGDTLVVEILHLRPNRDTAVSTQGGNFGALVPDFGTAFLNDPYPSARYVWRLDLDAMTGTLALPDSALGSITVPLEPMLGRVAVAPAGAEAFGGLWPGPFGGNLDAADVREGSTVYLPVFHPGALFYFGDGHALQGDGEVCGSGLETSMDVRLRFDLQKGRRIAWPRIEDAEFLMVAGSARPLTDALRIAFVELIGWLVDEYGFAEADAYQVVSQLASVRVANVVDPVYTVVARFPRHYLEPAGGVAAGTYSGILPCADCPGIENLLELRPSGLFTLRETYQGVDDPADATHARIGSWRQEDGQVVLSGDGASGAAERRLRPTAEGGLRWLALDGSEIESDLPYELAAAATADEAAAPLLRVRGWFRYLADAPGFRPCGVDRTLPVAQEGEAYLALEGGALERGDGAPFPIELPARLLLRTSLEESQGEVETLIVAGPATPLADGAVCARPEVSRDSG